MRGKVILHPFLFAMYAGLSLLATNIAQIGLAGLVGALLPIPLAILLIVLLRVVLKDTLKASLIATGTLLLVFSYGHVKNIAQGWSVAGFVLGQAALLLPLWGLLFCLWTYWVRRGSPTLGPVSDYLNWVGLILLIFPIYTLAAFSRRSQMVEPWIQQYLAETWSSGGVSQVGFAPDGLPAEQRPDVYFIVLDAYARADILQEMYGYDDSEFVDSLHRRGFYVADQGRANYTDTVFSVASSLNMVHLNTMPEFFRLNAGVDDEGVYARVAAEFISHNRARDLFSDLGYASVAFDTGYQGTQVRDADIFMSSPAIEDAGLWETGFGLLLLDTTLGREVTSLIGRPLPPMERLFTAHRERVLYTLGHLADFAAAEGNYFVYAHVVSPHVPFVFGPNGEELEATDPYTLLDAHPGNPENIGRYRDQVHYLSILILQAIDRILAESDTPPIIILQSDHGGKIYGDPALSDEARLDLLFPSLEAYLVPGAPADLFYPSITPVNSLRVILDYSFGADLGLLADASYLLESRDGHSAFVDACVEYQACQPE
jgi:hypothetical protein